MDWDGAPMDHRIKYNKVAPERRKRR